VLNIGLAISTVITGEHYVVDELAALVIVSGSVAIYWWCGRRLLTTADG
jgi:hypothetical protein